MSACENRETIAAKLIWLRMCQLIINNYCKSNKFKVPVHLALGHEALALSVDQCLKENDALFLSHRNVHYNLVRQNSLEEEINEYLLREDGLASGKLGSMNLNNPSKGIPYASSILGNNLPVASGYALGNKVKQIDSITFVVTGDGAIEEGAFYETLLFLKSLNLSSIVLIENNNWSLATKIEERRSEINLEELARSMGIEYALWESNDVFSYIKKLKKLKERVLAKKSPMIIEVKLSTLGNWLLFNDQYPKGKFINYHAGSAPNLGANMLNGFPVIEETDSDPLFVLKNHFSIEKLNKLSKSVLLNFKNELV